MLTNTNIRLAGALALLVWAWLPVLRGQRLLDAQAEFQGFKHDVKHGLRVTFVVAFVLLALDMVHIPLDPDL